MLLPYFNKIRTRIIYYIIYDIYTGFWKEINVWISISVMGTDIPDKCHILTAKRVAAQKRAFVVPAQSLRQDRVGYGYIVILPLTANRFVLRP